MLPEGWREVKFAEVVIKTQLGTTKRGAAVETRENYFLVKMGNLSWGGLKLHDVERVGKTESLEDYVLSRGDFLFNTRNTKELVGKSAVWLDNSSSYCFDNNINRIWFSGEVSTFFLAYSMNFGAGKKAVRALASGSTSVSAIYWKSLKNLPIKLPPLPEQKKIAAILSTWDQAIETTEKLLTNSQQQKKALMQQLLTGKKRLPGFTGEWRPHFLKEIASIEKGKTLSAKNIEDGPYKVIAGGKKSPYSHKLYTHENVITVSASGAYAGYVSRHLGKIWASDCSVISILSESNLEYIYYYLKFYQSNLYTLQTGGAQPHVYPRDIESLTICCPDYEEQKAIAAILTKADEEITLLKADLTRLRQEKKALMQQLLTGKRRVIPDPEAG